MLHDISDMFMTFDDGDDGALPPPALGEEEEVGGAV